MKCLEACAEEVVLTISTELQASKIDTKRIVLLELQTLLGQ